MTNENHVRVTDNAIETAEAEARHALGDASNRTVMSKSALQVVVTDEDGQVTEDAVEAAVTVKRSHKVTPGPTK